ncbi:MAG TPA: CvpA family protein [Bacilli bacterium]|jgi:uncharacterized membrane protein required for colicin V production|nr:CvpA family protein [Bacilli bacterium]
MGKIDLAIIALTLIFVLLGFFKGLVKGALSTANWLLSLVAPFILTKPVSRLLMKTAIYDRINEKVATWIASKGDAFSQPFAYEGYREQLTEAISELGLPKFLASLISDGINIADAPEGLTLSEVLAPAFSNIIVTVLAVIMIIVFFMIVFKIIISLFSKLFEKGVLGFVNRILGAGLGLVKAFIMISVLMLLVSVLSGVIPSLNEFLVADLRLESAGFGIGKYFYERNPLIEIFKGTFSLDGIFS